MWNEWGGGTSSLESRSGEAIEWWPTGGKRLRGVELRLELSCYGRMNG